jgi:predicted nucleotidyltransferase
VRVASAELTPLRELLELHRDEIRAIVSRHHGNAVSVFGSVARGEEGPDSDIDLLVDWLGGLDRSRSSH